MSGYDLRDHDVADAAPAAGRVAAGKRTLTQAIPTLAGRERAVTPLDPVEEPNDTRSTIDGPAAAEGAPGPLTARQLRRARGANPRWHERLHFAPGVFGGAALDSPEFALGVAEKQAQLGVPVDGVAGPRTVAAAGASAQRDAALEATRGRRDASGAAARANPGGMDALVDDLPDTRATIDGPAAGGADLMDPFANDDPFGMHLIGT